MNKIDFPEQALKAWTNWLRKEKARGWFRVQVPMRTNCFNKEKTSMKMTPSKIMSKVFFLEQMVMSVHGGKRTWVFRGQITCVCVILDNYLGAFSGFFNSLIL